MKIAILGMGYVGCTVAACLIEQSHTVYGVETDQNKRTSLAAGESPVSEPGVAPRLKSGIESHRFRSLPAAQDLPDDVDIIMVSVGTPSSQSGEVDITAVIGVTKDIGHYIRNRETDKSVLCVYRSTMVPGSMDQQIIPALEEAVNAPPGIAYDVAYNPEFLRESTAVADYFAPPKIVIGEREPGITDQLRGLYQDIDAPVFETSFSEAELVKYGDNWFHATKVAFANEMGRIAHSLGISAEEVMRIFVSDTKLNISPYYLRPGLPFGGSCLPKDVRALQSLTRRRGIAMPLLESVTVSNASHLSYTIDRLTASIKPGDTALMMGLSFKTDTDDLRESPLVELAEALLGKGIRLRIYDPDLRSSALIGANLKYALEKLPHLEELLVSSVETIGEEYDYVIIGKRIQGLSDFYSTAATKAHIIDVTKW